MKRASELKMKALFIILKGPSVAKNFLRPESASLKLLLSVEVIYMENFGQ